MSKFADASKVLESYISPMNARALLLRVVRGEGFTPESLTAQDLRRCASALRRGASLFVPPSRLEEAMAAINAICGSDSMNVDACMVELRTELDIGSVRARARTICASAQANPFVAQKVATVVSELARNVVMYAGHGSIEIVPYRDKPRRIVVRAIDNGPGIKNLDEIMAGRYRSKSGMGKGLLGIKRLADAFKIETDHNGTRVVAEVYL